MAGMSVGGLVSGLDTNSIVAQLTALEQMKVTREEEKKTNAQNTLDKFKELQTYLGNLAQKASALDDPNDFNVFKSNSNYEDYATISGKEGATAGEYELVINQLATTQKVASKSYGAINEAVNTAGKITISTSTAAQKADSTKKEVEVEIVATDTLKDIVNKINAAEGSGVRASIMSMASGDNRLVLTAVDTGTTGFFLKDSTGSDVLGASGLGILNYNSEKAKSSGALISSDGFAVTNETTFEDIDTGFPDKKIVDGDKLGIYLPIDDGDPNNNLEDNDTLTDADRKYLNGGWVTFDLFNADGSSKEIGTVLTEINSALEASGANFTAKLNSCGEIVLEGNLADDPNFGSATLKDVKIQMGTFDDSTKGFSEVKKTLGTFGQSNIYSNVINEGKNAIYTIDGMAVSSQSNNDESTITGTVFTLKKISKEGMEPIKLSMELDKEALAGKITAFIDEFNSLMSFIDKNSKATVTEETDKTTGKKVSKRQVGAFTGDSAISSLRDNLKRMLTGTIDELTPTRDNGYTTVYSSAARLGITTQKDGSLSIDRKILDKALTSDFEGVRRLFTSNSFSDDPGFRVGRASKDAVAGTYEIKGTGSGYDVFLNGEKVEATLFDNILTIKGGLSIEVPRDLENGKSAKVTYIRGVSSQVSNFVEKAKNTVDGFFKQTEETYQDRIDSIEKRIEELQIRVNNYNDRISKQFAALERSMGNLQSQTANMMAALGGTRN